MNKYLVLKKQLQKEINNFPVIYAFTKKDLINSLPKLNITENEIDKITSIGGGDYILKTDLKRFNEIFDNYDKTLKDNFSNLDFVVDMFSYELSNHEYCVTYDITDTLNCLGITENEIEENKILKQGLKKAISKQKECW